MTTPQHSTTSPSLQTESDLLQLNDQQLQDFREKGYCLVPGVLDKETCRKFDTEIVQPALLEYGGLDESDETTWNSSLLQSMATGCLLYTSPSPRDMRRTRMPSSA